jgi:TPR repeat protein
MTSSEFDKLRTRAQKEDSKSMLDLAVAYSEGDGVEHNDGEFFSWIRKAALAGEPEAAYELAYAYERGIGTQPDHERFVEWLEEAARLGFLRAIFDLANLCKEGEGVPKDEERFFQLMKKAAQKGDPDAMLDLAFAFRDRIGTRRNHASYLRWLTKAAESDNSEAMFHLAFEFKNRLGAPKTNLKEFFYWLRKAAEEGQPDALFHLAIAYQNGEGTNKSQPNYFRWMKKAAEAEIPAALYHLAMSYFIRSKPDRKKFSEWIKKALKAGHPKAFIASGLDDLRRETLVSNVELAGLNKDLNELFERVMAIKRRHIVKSRNAINGVAHFTRFEVLDSMLPAERPAGRATNRLRLYNFAYMNDPQEGRRLLDKRIAAAESLIEFFTGEGNADNPLTWEDHESSVYIGSFTLKDEDLDIWRAYGHDGQGYCIVTPLDSFDQGTSDKPTLHGDEVVNVSEAALNVSEAALKGSEFLPTTLYLIRYSEAEVRSTLNELKGSLDRIRARRKKLKGNTKALDRTVRLIVSYILYLYKNEQYRYEREARLISDFDISFKYLSLDQSRSPSRIFVESPDFLFKEGTRIIIGPRVQEKTVVELDLKFRLARHGLLNNTRVSRSKLSEIYR